MSINLQTGALLKNELYADKPLGARFQSTIYPLHLGTYFGVTGQIIVFIAALALPGFGITGWMLYLNRRKQKRIARAERAQFAARCAGRRSRRSGTDGLRQPDRPGRTSGAAKRGRLAQGRRGGACIRWKT
jgi:hypothetical protein